jgi:hypothetical protein
MKNMVTVELTDAKKSYVGRFLGLVDDKEFHTIISKHRSQGKVFSAESVPLSDIAKNYEDLDGLRFVLAVKEVDGHAPKMKLLFISDRLSYVANQITANDIGILSANDEYYELRERSS